MIDLVDIKKTYRTKNGAVEALRGVSLSVGKSDIYGIIGTSSVKSGPIMAGANSLNIELIGKSDHGAPPELGIDAIVS